VKWDKDGLQLADVPNAGVVVRRKTASRGGNPTHDARSGKFGRTGPKPKEQQAPAPANVDPEEYRRMLDAVRDAARQLETIDESAITEFVQGRANHPDQVDIANFMAMVTEQRKADLIDIVDDNLREQSNIIRLTASGDTVKQLMRQLGSDEVAEIMTRLEGMGHKPEEIDAYFDGRIAVAEEAKKKRDATRA
jgi:hypothetical protein